MKPYLLDQPSFASIVTSTAPASASVHGRFLPARHLDGRSCFPAAVEATSPGWGGVTWLDFGGLDLPANRESRSTPPPTTQPAPSKAERILAAPIQVRVRELAAALSLNKSLLADVLGVTRPTIYEWLDGQEPGPHNNERLAQLLQRLGRHGVDGSAPLNARFVRHPIDDGPSLLDELRRPQFDEERLDKLIVLARRLDIEARTLAETRERAWEKAGFDALTDEVRKAYLAQDVAMLDWPR